MKPLQEAKRAYLPEMREYQEAILQQQQNLAQELASIASQIIATFRRQWNEQARHQVSGEGHAEKLLESQKPLTQDSLLQFFHILDLLSQNFPLVAERDLSFVTSMVGSLPTPLQGYLDHIVRSFQLHLDYLNLCRKQRLIPTSNPYMQHIVLRDLLADFALQLRISCIENTSTLIFKPIKWHSPDSTRMGNSITTSASQDTHDVDLSNIALDVRVLEAGLMEEDQAAYELAKKIIEANRMNRGFMTLASRSMHLLNADPGVLGALIDIENLELLVETMKDLRRKDEDGDIIDWHQVDTNLGSLPHEIQYTLFDVLDDILNCGAVVKIQTFVRLIVSNPPIVPTLETLIEYYDKQWGVEGIS